jgi:succinate-acetate transporter protein
LEARVFLQPVAAPVVLGSFALTSGLLIYGTWLAAAWGGPAEPKTFFPFILLFSGLGELGAAMWSYRARDAVSASIFGAWAAFWLGWGVMWILALGGTITIPARGTAFASMGQWFIYMAVISWTTAFAALARSPGRFVAQALLGTASAVAAGSMLAGSPSWEHTAGWLFFASACLFFYIGAATMLDNVFGVVVLPLLEWRRGANRPGAEPTRPIQWEHGEPGVKVGQ